MKINKKQFDKVLKGGATKQEIEKLIKLADQEMFEWNEFKNYCLLLLTTKNN